jgi:hypothetical protein
MEKARLLDQRKLRNQNARMLGSNVYIFIEVVRIKREVLIHFT